MSKKRDSLKNSANSRKDDKIIRPPSAIFETAFENVKGKMTVAEAGQRGGLKGGAAVRKKYGSSYFVQMGKMGGEALKQVKSSQFYSEIGRLGGMSVMADKGVGFFVKIGQKGGRKVREMIELARQAARYETPDES